MTPSQDAPDPDPTGIRGLLGLWAIYLAFAVVMGIISADARVFLCVGFLVPAILVAVFAFAVLLVAAFMVAVYGASRVASWAYHRYLWDHLRFHVRGWAASSEGKSKDEDRRRTGWGLLADGLSGFAMGLVFGGVISIPLLGSGVLSGHFLAESPPWLAGLGVIMLAMGVGGSYLGLVIRLVSDPLWAMTREKVALLPPDDEYF